MGELLDRKFQHEILTKLATEYPQKANVKRAFGPQEDNRLTVNLAYLDEHDLISVVWFNELAGRTPGDAGITKRGLDFLADDGGLSAILNVVTVKLHGDTIRELLIGKIEAADAPSSVKASLITKIKDLPADALSHLITSTMDAGLSNIPDMIGWLQTLLRK